MGNVSEKRVSVVPFYQDEFVKIFNASSENMFQIPDRSVHCVITSPPYNVGREYRGHNDELSVEDYLSFLRPVFEECYRVLVKGGRICVNVPSVIRNHRDSRFAYTAFYVWNLLKEVGFLEREILAWIKPEAATDYTSWGSWASPSNPALRDGMEYVVIMCKEDYKLEGRKEDIDLTDEEFLRLSVNYWVINPESKTKVKHPAPFPEALVYGLLKLYTYRGNTVLDPFMGSGTTLKVAKMLGRYGIGFEISEDYCKTAVARILEAPWLLTQATVCHWNTMKKRFKGWSVFGNRVLTLDVLDGKISERKD